MSTTRRVLWLIVLLCSTAGCATVYAPVPWTRPEEGEAATYVERLPLEVGDDVRIVLVDGTELTGRFAVVTADTLTLETNLADNIGPEFTTTDTRYVRTGTEVDGTRTASYEIPVAEIRSIERSDEVAGQAMEVVTVSALFGLIAIAGILVGAALSGGPF